MSKFKRKGKGGTPEISTASLPDIIFMLLFFFMVSTTMREVELKIRIKLPEVTELKKLEKKSLVSYIYIGPPTMSYESKYGTEPRIQLNDAFATVDDLSPYVDSEKNEMPEHDRPKLTMSLKVHNETKMGIVSDVKQALRKCNALKINYSARQEVANN